MKPTFLQSELRCSAYSFTPEDGMLKKEGVTRHVLEISKTDLTVVQQGDE